MVESSTVDSEDGTDTGETDRCLAAVATFDSMGKRRRLKQQWERGKHF